MKTFHLVRIGRDTFVMLNADKPLLNYQCNSMIFDNKEDATKNISVFDYFKLPVHIIQKLDMRTNKAKYLVNQYGFFSAQFLPEIKKRNDNNYYTYVRPNYNKIQTS